MAHILLVDDDDLFRDMVLAMLERLGHTVLIARNGNEALARFAEERADLVITDLIMPDKEGLQTIRELHQAARDLPIIAMSGGGRNNPEVYLKTARTMGAVAVLTKPFSFKQLASAINSALPHPPPA